MKKMLICVAAGLLTLVACTKTDTPNPDVDNPNQNVENPVAVDNPITISSPTPTEEITKVSLNATQQGYVKAGNAMAFRFLKQLYEGENLICSPLSLQYALAMAANGASGETLQEIIDFLGYGTEGINALNEYSRILLEQLPAVDLDVTLKVTDALLVNKDFPLLPAFKQTMEDFFYAAVDNMDFSDPQQVAARINDWAKRNTNGFIDKVLDSSDISEDAVAFLMNALYFKAAWAGSDYDPMFADYATIDDWFKCADGSVQTVKMMQNMKWHRYAEMDGYKVLALPSHDGKMDVGEVAQWLHDFYADPTYDHMVFPGMVYITFATEMGTIYSLAELQAISDVCKRYGLPLFIDGARLGYGLMAEGCDVTLEQLADLCDVFYIGGTKCGAYCGEAVVFPHHNAPEHFFTMVKQHGALLAKGRLLGIQFDTLMTDSLYFKIARHAVEQAMRLRDAFVAKGYQMYSDSPTNQQFVLLDKDTIARLEKDFVFEQWYPVGDLMNCRFVTSWATRPEDVDALIVAL